HQRNSPRTGLLSKCVRRRLRDLLRRSNRRSRSAFRVASCLAQRFSNCRRPHSKPEQRWDRRAEQVEQATQVRAWPLQLVKSVLPIQRLEISRLALAWPPEGLARPEEQARTLQ